MRTNITLRYSWLLLVVLFAGGCSRSAKDYLQSAKKYFDAGKYDDAILLYRKAIQKEPKSGEAYYRLALADLKIGKAQEAFQALQAASSLSGGDEEIQSVFADFCYEAYLLNPARPKAMYDRVAKVSEELLNKNKKSYNGLRLKGYLEIQDKKPSEAIATLREADQVRPMQPQVIYPLTNALRMVHQDQEAERLSLALIKQNKTFGPSYDLLFAIYETSGRQQQAEDILKAKVDNNPKQSSYVLNLAGYYQARKRPEDAKRALQRMIDNPKDYPLAHASVGDFYFALRNVDAARSEYEQGIQSDPKDKAVYQKRLVNLMLFQGKKDEAKGIIQELAKSQPKDEEVQMVQSTMWIEGGKAADVDAAINLLKPLVEKKPTDANRRYRLGQAYALRGKMQEAETQWREAAKNDPRFVPARLALAELTIQTNRYPMALKFAEEILDLDAKNAGARFLHAIALVNLSDADKGREELNALLKDKPESAIAQLAMARLDLLQKNFPAAEKRFSDLYKVGGNDLRPLDGLLAAYVMQREPGKALTLLEKELARSPDNPGLLARRAEVYARSGQFSAARDDYQKLLAKDPNSAHLYRKIGEISVALKDNDTAIRSFEKSTALDPKDTRGLMDLGSMFLTNGKKHEALDTFRRALAQNPDEPLLLNNIAYLIVDTGGDSKEAMDLARKGLEKMPKDPHLTDTIGYIYWKQHLNDSAIQTFRTVVQIVPESATYRLHYANALISKGDKTEARTQLEAALMRNPAKDEESEIKTLLAQIGQ